MAKNTVRGPVARGCAKTPVVMQMEALECGAACLTMVLAYFGKWVPLEQVRLDCGVSRDGSNAWNVLAAARNYGLEAEGYRMEPHDLREKGFFPCIIHWNFNHFVVLRGFRGDRALLNDPARGEVWTTMEEFDESFTGICLMFEPSERFVPDGKPKSTVAFARKRLRGAGIALLFVTVTTVITSLFGLINPVMSRIFIDRMLSGKNPEWLMPFVGLVSVLALLQIVTAWVNAIYSLRINGKLAVVGSTSYMWKVLRLPMEFFSQRMAGDILNREASNAAIAGTLVNTLAPLALNTGMMVFYLVVMLRHSLLLTAVGLASIVLNLLVSRIISARRVNITRIQLRDAGKLASATISGIEMIETIKAGGAENGFFRRWAGYQASVNAQEVKFARVNQVWGLIPQLVSIIANYAVLILGVGLVIRGQFTLGGITAFQGFLSAFLGPAMTLVSAGQTLLEMRTEMERVEDVMQYPVAVEPDGADPAPAEDTDYSKLSGEVELRNVTFGYSRLSPPLIENFSMHVRPGGSIALVGASGCGKSTLSKLISGLYRPWTGEILFDGKPREEIDRSVFTGSLAVVDQDITLFEDTVGNNIRMWDRSIEDFEVILAARDAKIHEDILKREGGFDYRLTEGGKDFSGGQRQRLEIARVLAQDPTIVIMDEATSALDARTEFEVVRAIRDRGVTTIVIAHRLSTIRDCDEIIVLDGGKAVERGTHAELMALNGRYAELVQSE